MWYDDLLTPNLINQMRQNKPKLIADDLEELGIPREVTHTILLGRGVYKWLSVRRKLIKLKDSWKDKIITTLSQIVVAKQHGDDYRLMYLRGYLRALEECRSDVRGLCHSERWQAPDFDKEASRFLQRLDKKERGDA